MSTPNIFSECVILNFFKSYAPIKAAEAKMGGVLAVGVNSKSRLSVNRRGSSRISNPRDIYQAAEKARRCTQLVFRPLHLRAKEARPSPLFEDKGRNNDEAKHSAERDNSRKNYPS